MSAALWGFLGVAVGAAVTFGTTLWQLKRARESEETAYKREREARRAEVEALALRQLQEEMGTWYSDVLHGGGCAFDLDDPVALATAEAYLHESPMARGMTVLWLIERCRDDELRVAVDRFMSSTMTTCQEVLGDSDTHTRDDFNQAMLPTATKYRELQESIGERLRALE